jgi:hypothetical protein
MAIYEEGYSGGSKESNESGVSVRDFLEEAFSRWRRISEEEQDIRSKALEDLKFSLGSQWPKGVESDRRSSGRPCLTINRIPQFLKQVTNEQRQNRYATQVSPVDDKGDPEVAEILQGVIRHIEISSDADVAYDTASDYQARMGHGYIRILTEYVDDETFDLEPRIHWVINPFTVYCDYGKLPDRSDMKYAFVVEELSRKDYEEKYPDSELASLTEFTSTGNMGGWASRETVRVAEYWQVLAEKRARCMYERPDGTQGVDWKDDIPKDADIVILQERDVEIKTVKSSLINAVEVIEGYSPEHPEEGEWPGKCIPIVPVVGEEIMVDGKRDVFGMVRNSKDPQRMYNYMASAEAESIGLAPKAPWIGAAGQFEGFKERYEASNRVNFAYLEYNPVDVKGNPVGPPVRNAIEPPIQAIAHARIMSSEDLKSVMGIYDASLGAKGNETSGVAIRARQREGDIATYNYADNLARSIRFVGRILVDIIPKIYDTDRIARIIGEDDEGKSVRITSDPNGAPVMEVPVENLNGERGGIEKIFNIGVGKYDVTINVGPSFSSKRQEAVRSMVELTQAYPMLVEVAGDLLVKNMDWPGAQEIAERLKKLLVRKFPEFEQGDEEDVGKIKSQFAALMQQHEALTQQLNILQDEKENKTLELASRERIETMKVQSDIAITEAKLGSEESITALKLEIDTVRESLSQLALKPEPTEVPGVGPEPTGR